jgi:thiopeptide-type bacteriocin biosynthesis protein
MSARDFNAEFAPAGFFVWRTPLLPLDDLLAWSEGLEAPAAEPNHLESAVSADRARLRLRLRDFIARPEVNEALFVSSPALIDALRYWHTDPESEQGGKVERALVRYVERLTSRPTPFGLFAGWSVGEVSAQTRLELGDRAGYQPHTRLDMDYLFALANALARQPGLREGLTVRPNSSLYRAAGRLRYAEARLRGKERSYHLVAVEPTDYLEATLDRARLGARPTELAAALVKADPEIARDEADEYVHELIRHQVLVPELSPPVTGEDAGADLVAQLRDHPAGEEAAGCLVRVSESLAALDRKGVGIDPDAYRATARLLDGLPAKAEPSRLFQVDMLKPSAAATLGPEVVAEIARGVDLLHSLARRSEDSLARFREAFLARYEGREVPLVEALDEDAGIGFDSPGPAGDASPLLEGFAFPGPKAAPLGDPRLPVLLPKLHEALRRGERELTLTNEDLKALRADRPPPLPDAFAVTAAVAAASDTALLQGDFRVGLFGCGGPSGARLLGRFCQADPRLRALVEQHLRAEETLAPETIFAEVVHLPEGRIGNVLCRPVLRAYEIPYLGRSGAPPAQQIPITDLLVSVPGGQVVLRSARLGKRVLPRLTTAHNYGWRALRLYKFLCALQDQGMAAGLTWDWGRLADAEYLPRVVTGRLVLARARWRVTRAELRALGQAQGAARFRIVQEWRRRRELPRRVLLAEGDNDLLIDLDNVLSIDAFAEMVKEREAAVLLEPFPGPDELCARGPEGRFVHELVVPFQRRPPTGSPGRFGTTFRPAQTRLPGASSQRSFPPGSEWLYAKLYTGTATADQVLREAVAPVTRAALASGAAQRWFFIRYGDPQWHLRWRLQGPADRLWSEVLPALHSAVAPLLKDGRLWRLQLDTYEPEVERYGGPEGIALAERVFQADSEAALALVEILPGDEGLDARWRLALPAMDLLMTDLGLDLNAKRQLVNQVSSGLAAELQVTSALRGQLSSRFRQERRALEALFASSTEAGAMLAEGQTILRRRSEGLVSVVAELKSRERAGQLTQSLTDMAISFVHLHANRLLPSDHRAHEWVLYGFLHRLYESWAARA